MRTLSQAWVPNICIISQLFSPVLSPFPCSVDASPWVPMDPSWESAVALLALERWARSHICSPWQGSRPVRPRRPPPLSPLLWYFPRHLRLLKQQSCSWLCDSSQSWAEAVPAAARGLFDTQPSIYQLSINNGLIKRSTSTIPLRWFAVTDSSGLPGFLSCSLFQFMVPPVSQAEWKLFGKQLARLPWQAKSLN